MPHDTMPEHDTSDLTGRFETERRVAVEAARAEAQAKSTRVSLPLAALVSLLIGGVGAGGSYVAQREESAETREQVRALEREQSAMRAQLDGIPALSRDVAALSAKVDAWRAGDEARVAAERADLQRRLTRLEELLDRRR